MEELARPAWHDAIDVEEAVLAGWRAPRQEVKAGGAARSIIADAAEAAAAPPVVRGRNANADEEVASTRPKTKHARSQVVAIAHPKGSRLAFLFEDGVWREGTVKGALSWAVGHKYQHWRRVRFDYGGILEVDTAALGVGGGPRTALHAPATPAPTAKWKMPAAVDSDDEEQMETSSGGEGSGSSEGEESDEDETESDEESGGEARQKKRRQRSQQRGRPTGANQNQFDEAGWEAMRARLAGFKAEHGHCQVPKKHPADPKLGGWVHNQRQQRKKTLDAGHRSPCITAGRAGGQAGGAGVRVGSAFYR